MLMHSRTCYGQCSHPEPVPLSIIGMTTDLSPNSLTEMSQCQKEDYNLQPVLEELQKDNQPNHGD